MLRRFARMEEETIEYLFNMHKIVTIILFNVTNIFGHIFWEKSVPQTMAFRDGRGKEGNGQTLDESDLSFTVRYCKKTVDINVTGYRVMFRNEIYDIVAVDYMNFKKKCIKIRCRKVRR